MISVLSARLYIIQNYCLQSRINKKVVFTLNGMLLLSVNSGLLSKIMNKSNCVKQKMNGLQNN